MDFIMRLLLVLNLDYSKFRDVYLQFVFSLLLFAHCERSVDLKMLGDSASPLIPLQSQGPAHAHNRGLASHRGSPRSLLDIVYPVPDTPLGIPGNAPHLLKTSGTPHTPSKR